MQPARVPAWAALSLCLAGPPVCRPQPCRLNSSSRCCQWPGSARRKLVPSPGAPEPGSAAGVVTFAHPLSAVARAQGEGHPAPGVGTLRPCRAGGGARSELQGSAIPRGGSDLPVTAGVHAGTGAGALTGVDRDIRLLLVPRRGRGCAQCPRDRAGGGGAPGPSNPAGLLTRCLSALPLTRLLPPAHSVGAPGRAQPAGEAAQLRHPVHHLRRRVQGGGAASAEQVLPHPVLRLQR